MEENKLGTVVCDICHMDVHFWLEGPDRKTAEGALTSHKSRMANMNDPWARFYHGPYIDKLRKEQDQITHA